MEELQEIVVKINAAGENVRKLKADKAAKEAIDAAVAELLNLKEEYKNKNNGKAYDPPKVEAPKKEKGPAVTASIKEGPSKKELNKLARKEARKGNDETKPEDNPVPPVPPKVEVKAPTTKSQIVTTVPSSELSIVSLKLEKEEANTLYYCGSSKFQASTDLSRTVASLLKFPISCAVSNKNQDHLPFMTSCVTPLKAISGDCTIARYIVKNYDSVGLLSVKDLWDNAEVDQWLDIYVSIGSDATSGTTIPSILEDHLATRTYIVGHQLSLADIAMYILCKRLSFKTSSNSVHLSRWFTLMQSTLPTVPTLKVAKNKVDNKSDGKDDEEESCPPLVDAVEGKVCTRFPPEPSGYLHIGHCKAVLLNQYYAQRYKGKLLVRFDDTNPSKEKEEFEENIIKDLETLGVVANKVLKYYNLYYIWNFFFDVVANDSKRVGTTDSSERNWMLINSNY